MNPYIHLPTYFEIPIGKKTIRFKRLNLMDTLAFIIFYNQYLLSKNIGHDNKSIRLKILKLLKIRRIRFTFNSRNSDEFIQKAKDLIISEKKKANGQTYRDWVTRLIGFFGLKCGWTKDEVLSLYPDEIGFILEAINSVESEYLLNLLGLIHNPKKYLEIVNQRKTSLTESHNGSLDRIQIDRLKRMQRK